MIARYAFTRAGLDDNTIDVEMDEDGPWCRWKDVVSHVDRALRLANRDDMAGVVAALEFIVNRGEP